MHIKQNCCYVSVYRNKENYNKNILYNTAITHMGNTHALGTQQKETYRSPRTPPKSPYLQIILKKKKILLITMMNNFYLLKNGFGNSFYYMVPWSLSQL
jgi:hypothetical protein